MNVFKTISIYENLLVFACFLKKREDLSRFSKKYISTSIHRYVNCSDIQVLMMVTETETFNVDFTSK